jgi:hypothetical protein
LQVFIHLSSTPNSHPSIYIPEVQILNISQIPKRRRVQIPPFKPSFHRALDLISTLVLSRQKEA